MLAYQKKNYLYQMVNFLNKGLRNRCHLVVAYLFCRAEPEG